MDTFELDTDVTATDLEMVETVEVGADLDSWMSAMLSGPSEFDY